MDGLAAGRSSEVTVPFVGHEPGVGAGHLVRPSVIERSRGTRAHPLQGGGQWRNIHRGDGVHSASVS